MVLTNRKKRKRKEKKRKEANANVEPYLIDVCRVPLVEWYKRSEPKYLS